MVDSDRKIVFEMLLRLIFVVILCIKCTLGFSTGAGSQACLSMTPNHQGNVPQLSASPVTILLSTNNVLQGQTVSVTIQGLRNDYAFRGFMIQARASNSADVQVVGSFRGTEGIGVVNCLTFPPNSVATHSNNELKTSITLFWDAPINFVGLLNFQ